MSVRRRMRSLGLVVVAALPGLLKRPALRWFFGFVIHPSARIGLAYLDCARLTIGAGARLGHGVVFVRCGEVRIGEHAIIGSANLFRGGTRIDLGNYSQVLRLNVVNAIPDNDCTGTPDPTFELGHGSVVTAEHRIDFTDRVTIGRCSILAGRNSSIWTHNRQSSRPVHIGDYAYIGSEVRIAPGAHIADCVIVALGSVVTGGLRKRFMLYGGVPTVRVRCLVAADAPTLFARTRPDLPDEAYPPFPSGPRAEESLPDGVEDRLGDA